MLALSAPGKRRLAYGFWRYREDEIGAAEEMLALARENDIDHLDTADVYGGPGGFGGSERLLGAVRASASHLFDGAVLATKIGIEPGSPYNSSPAYLTAACDASLSRLRIERIDLLYIHRPDLLTHPIELAQTLDGLVSSGKAAAIGVSNFTPAQVTALSRHMKAPIAVHQLEFSAAHIDPLFDGTLDQAMAHGIAVAAWSPLAGGRLGGADATPTISRIRETLERIGKHAGISPMAVALAFLHRHPAPITPILGTRNPARLRDCLKANGFTLSRADWYAIVEACRGERMP
ncbi:MAG TPA: aldo/keto reductase [Rhizomicrobium sp.]